MWCNNREQLAESECCGCVQMATRTKGRSCRRRRGTKTSWRRSSTARTLMWTACCLKVLSVTSLSVSVIWCCLKVLSVISLSLSLSLSLSVNLCCLKVLSVTSVCLSVCLSLSLSLYAVLRYGLSPLSLCCSVCVLPLYAVGRYGLSPLSLCLSLSGTFSQTCKSGAVNMLYFVWKFSCIKLYSLIHAQLCINHACNFIFTHQ